MRYYTTVVILLLSCALSAQYALKNYGGAIGYGMGEISVPLLGAEALYSGPGTMLQQDGWSASLSSERRYAAVALVQLGGLLSYQRGAQGVSLRLQTVGLASYRQRIAGVGYRRRLSSALSLGAEASWRQLQIEEYGARSQLNVRLGARLQIIESVQLSAAIHELLPTEWRDQEDAGTNFLVGLSWQAGSTLDVYAELEKYIDLEAQIKAGFNYRPIESLQLRAGVVTEPASFHLGIGYALTESLRLDIAGARHEVLGNSASAGINYNFGN